MSVFDEHGLVNFDIPRDKNGEMMGRLWKGEIWASPETGENMDIVEFMQSLETFFDDKTMEGRRKLHGLLVERLTRFVLDVKPTEAAHA